MNRFDKDKQKGILGTILFHALLLFCLFFLALKTPLPIPAEEGVEVDLGYSADGMGLIQPDILADQQPKPTRIIQQQDEEEKLVTQDIEDAPAIVEKKKEVPKPIKPIEKVVPEKVDRAEPSEVTEPVKEEPKVDQRALFKGSGTSTQSGSEGITGKPGDQGNPNGLRDVKRYEGSGGTGNGPMVSLGGRGAKYLDKPSTDVTERGEVVVDIWVDRNGKVTKALVNPKGTTIVNSRLREIAVQAAKKSTFEADSKAEEIQKGTITYSFIY